MSIKHFKVFLLIISLLPLIIKFPYILQAWQISRLDRWDSVFFLLAVGMIVWSCIHFRKLNEKINCFFLAGVLFSCLVYGIGLLRDIHAVMIVGAIWYIWSMWGLLYGSKIAAVLLPAFGILLLACPSSNYWLGFLVGGNGLLLKSIIAIVLLTWQCGILWYGRSLELNYILFTGALLLLGMLYFVGSWRYEVFPAMQPPMKNLSVGTFLGRIQEPTASDRRFFGNSKIERIYFAGDQNSFSVLKTSEFENVHKIHPASHCLRSSGQMVLEENLRVVSLKHGNLQVSEILTEGNSGNIALVWVWYGNSNDSSGSFLHFRRAYSPEGSWSSYQLAIPIIDGKVEAARVLLQQFLEDWISAN